MHRFYFHLATRKGWMADDIGSLCPTAEHAMLEAWRAACETSVDLLRQGESPSDHRFEVHDEAGLPVFELPFADLLAGVPRPGRPDTPVWSRLQRNMATTQRLQSELAATLLKVRSTVAETVSLLQAE